MPKHLLVLLPLDERRERLAQLSAVHASTQEHGLEPEYGLDLPMSLLGSCAVPVAMQAVVCGPASKTAALPNYN